MKPPPFDAARRGGSNELRYIFLRPLDAGISNETVNGAVTKMLKCRIIDISLHISASSGRRRMKSPPFDAAQQGGSNELRYILLRPLDAEMIDEM
jgi:hypothetical protein